MLGLSYRAAVYIAAAWCAIALLPIAARSDAPAPAATGIPPASGASGGRVAHQMVEVGGHLAAAGAPFEAGGMALLLCASLWNSRLVLRLTSASSHESVADPERAKLSSRSRSERRL